MLVGVKFSNLKIFLQVQNYQNSAADVQVHQPTLFLSHSDIKFETKLTWNISRCAIAKLN